MDCLHYITQRYRFQGCIPEALFNQNLLSNYKATVNARECLKLKQQEKNFPFELTIFKKPLEISHQ